MLVVLYVQGIIVITLVPMVAVLDAERIIVIAVCPVAQRIYGVAELFLAASVDFGVLLVLF